MGVARGAGRGARARFGDLFFYMGDFDYLTEKIYRRGISSSHSIDPPYEFWCAQHADETRLHVVFICEQDWTGATRQVLYAKDV